MLTDDAFMRLVAEDVKNKVSDSQKSYLRLPENLDRWEKALNALIGNLDDQINEIRIETQIKTEAYAEMGDDGIALLAEFQTAMEQRQRKISRFKFYVESRLDEVHRLQIAGGHENAEARLAEFFRRAIERHQEMIIGLDLDFSEIDEALWATLRGRWDFDDIDMDEFDVNEDGE